jgi:hypothetical protein
MEHSAGQRGGESEGGGVQPPPPPAAPAAAAVAAAAAAAAGTAAPGGGGDGGAGGLPEQAEDEIQSILDWVTRTMSTNVLLTVMQNEAFGGAAGPGVRGLSSEQIARLTTEEWTGGARDASGEEGSGHGDVGGDEQGEGDSGGGDEEAERCAVCQQDYERGDSLLRLPCGHRFHAECATPWLRRANTCPNCRAPANPGAVEDSDEATDR